MVGQKLFADCFTLEVDRSSQNFFEPFFDPEGKLPGGRHPPLIEKWRVPPGLCRQEMRLGAAHGAYGCRIRGL